MLAQKDIKHVEVVPGHSWITGDGPPKIDGWKCFFVAHYGAKRTVYTYRRVTAS